MTDGSDTTESETEGASDRSATTDLPPAPAGAITGEGVETVVAPTPAGALAVCERALARDALLTVFGRCTVEYDGRATSSLGAGDRLLVCKPDGSVLVHTDEGQQPVNWQPPGCTVEPALVAADGEGASGGGGAASGGKRLRVRSERTTPVEELVVDFERVAQVSAYDAVDPEELALTGTEADLRERILADPELVEPGFRPLATERQTPAGAVDVYGEDADGRTVVLELKRRRVGPDAVGQLSRYVDALRRDLHDDASVRGVLVAPSVTDRARRLLAEQGLEFVSLEPPDNS